MRTAVFTKVEGVAYSSVMITGNMRQAIAGAFAAAFGGPVGTFRRSSIVASLCLSFGVGAAIGAFSTKQEPELALGIPVILLLIVLLRCEIQRHEGRI